MSPRKYFAYAAVTAAAILFVWLFFAGIEWIDSLIWSIQPYETRKMVRGTLILALLVFGIGPLIGWLDESVDQRDTIGSSTTNDKESEEHE